MSFKHVDFDSVMRRLAEKRIEEAISQGKFDNLPGFGKPLELEPMPASEDARLAWWALRLMRQNDYTPDEIQWRKRIDTLKDELATATSVRRVTALVAQINGIVRQLNTLGTNAIHSAISQLSLPAELRKLQERTQPIPLATSDAPAVGDVARRCGNRACGASNPTVARYCGQCGSALDA